MVKLDYEHDYYADLELPVTADAAEVKRQFKKLALKFHPDRNPGKEDEAKEKFLVIQAAHEILADPVTKSKFDAYRLRTNRYPAASGIRGNPWQYTAQEVNQKFGAPPKRPPMPTRPTAATGASRYWDWNPKPKTKTENFRANMEAWDRSRPQSKTSQPSAAAAAKAREPPTPRTAAQARRQEASFGTRRTGFTPTSPAGDEPPVRNQHYNVNTNTNTAAQENATQPRKPRPMSAFDEPTSETFLDSRQRTPYAANVGEKTNPFEGLNVNRAKSMRDGARRFQDAAGNPPPTPPRPRSASVGSDNLNRSTSEKPGLNEPRQSAFASQSRASARYSPHFTETSSAPATATFPAPDSSTASASSRANATVDSGTSAQPGNGTKVYESPALSQYRNIYSGHPAGLGSHSPHSNRCVGEGAPLAHKFGIPAYAAQDAVPTPSGERSRPRANAFESLLHAQLQFLLGTNGHQMPKQNTSSAKPSALSPETSGHRVNRHANTTRTASFTVPDDDPTSPSQQARFTPGSPDNINTRFVAEEKGGVSFQFSAGSQSAAEDGFLRAKNRARGRQSPLRKEFTSSGESFAGAPQPKPQQSEASKQQGDFDAEGWKGAFGPHIFEPPQPVKPSVSPSRPIRPMRKQRPVRMTAGTAGLVDDEETSSEERAQPSATAGDIHGSRSPNAMDIDTPPSEPSAPQTNGARNINVEPTKPEWRAGNVNGVNPEPKLGDNLKIPTKNPNAAGSEDSEDFLKPMFSEFRNVEPFAQRATGLDSFADLSSNLPFPSRPAAKVPLAHERPERGPTPIPSPPTAPRPPPGLMIPGTKLSAPDWLTYAREFENYLRQWFDYNKMMTGHFSARQNQNERKGLGWVNMRSDAGTREYLRALEDDKQIRQRWMAACDSHELHFREFQKHRDWMMRQQ